MARTQFTLIPSRTFRTGGAVAAVRLSPQTGLTNLVRIPRTITTPRVDDAPQVAARSGRRGR